jgi:hypothetical protein
MAYRKFRDADGAEWEAWDVVPRLEERRHGERRARSQSTDPLDRRHHMERRLLLGRRAAALGLEHGWLCFERGEEKRRLAPIPADWPRCNDARLAELCRAAEAVRRRATPRTPAEPTVAATAASPLLTLNVEATPAPELKTV